MSTIKPLIIFCTITHFLFFGIPAQASSATKILNLAEQLNLASHPTWLKLLHYERNTKHSVVLTKNFFISSNGRNNPSAELSATINAYFAPWEPGNMDEHARCRFPARYFWLSQQLPLPNYKIREPKCQKLENWALFERVKSISLLLVSGYLGNPASTFGHTLLKLNTDSTTDNQLFDLTLNYGALVPENENTLLYVVRGLWGGYEAGFSDKYFYTQDMVYSHTEQRDIWEYKLILSDEERLLLIFHIWEIVGHKFGYYFLDKNCAYRLAELLELVIDEELLGNVLVWYVPVELFHRLNDIDKVRHESIGQKLIQSVRFIPSSQRKFYQKLNLLTTEELEIFNSIILKGLHFSKEELEKISIERRILILDNLLAYYEYKLLADKPESIRKKEEIKKQILLARLQLPVRSMPTIKIPDLPSPAEGSPPMEFGFNIANESNKDVFLRLNWSPFKKELIGSNSLEGDELVVFDLTVGIHKDEHKIFLDQLDFIRVINLNTLPIQLADENHWSWKLRVGADRIEKEGKYRYDGVVSFGAGYAWEWNKNLITYGIADISAHTLAPYVRLRPHLGFRFDWRKTRAWFYLGTESASDNKFYEVWGGKIQYQLTDRYAFYAEFSNEKATQSSIGLKWYW
ncbi:MAG: hypothetical protein DRR08_10105 [Candidatus Parabeggiatoa sp. nov. 2]|nr:MAG: hypothetical protein B6247_13550 [Beggiatoa sp. 4572_84]RKZ60911.1 MAG: hypothetical protein DRR08_10105 [Gammaproteobacteria bacterium]